MDNSNGSSNTNTVLIVIVLLLLVGFGVWWFTVRGGNSLNDGANLDVDVNLPTGGDNGGGQ